MRVILLEPTRLNREQLMNFGWVTGDENPIHFDTVAAQKRGLPKLIVHGMYLYSLVHKEVEDFISEQLPQYRILELTSKFSGMTFVDDAFSIELDVPDTLPQSESLKLRAVLLNEKNETNCSFQIVLTRIDKKI